MTFKAELKFNDSQKQYVVVECDYEYTQEIDQTLKPCAKPKSGIVNVVVEAMADTELIKWMVAPGNVRSGEIKFQKDDMQGAEMKTLSFKEAICIRFHEKFSAYGENPMLTTISFVAKELTLNGISHTAQWTRF
ncbi:MAG TPA: type VI secretion system tube protein TssD [Bacteroidales bacterium]|nr:type VI secretion system tube protein TssD [Bacteroidales bacterium]